MKTSYSALKWIILLLASTVSSHQSWAASKINQAATNAVEVQVFGPERFIRHKKKPVTELRNFTASQVVGQATLYISNGAPNGKDRVSSALISLNGEYVALPKDFNQQVAELAIPVNLASDNQLSVQLRGKPNSYLSMSIISISESTDDTPPNVSLTLNSASDSGFLGDGMTTLGQVGLIGLTEANTPVSLFNVQDPSTALSTTHADENGQYSFTTVELSLGANKFFVTATDVAGNTGRADIAIFQMPCELDSTNLSSYFVEPINQPVRAASSQLYMPDSDSFVGQFSAFDLPSSEQLVVMVGEVNGDLHADVMLLMPRTNEILVFLNDGNLLSSPTTYNTGAGEPIALAVGNFVDDVFVDIAIGHADGSLSFLMGDGQGNFTLMPDGVLGGFGRIVDLINADLDNDGDLDLGISGGSQIHILRNDNDLLNTEQLLNGDFQQGLSNWQINIMGHQTNSLQGHVSAQFGRAVLSENGSFLTTLKQTFRLSVSPQVLSFDLVSANLDPAGNGIPDTFEVSLLTDNNQSVVPTIDPLASAFFNLNPNGIVSLAPGVTYVDGKVSLDISAVAHDTPVTLYFDVIGNPPGQSSTVSIANVDAGSGVKYVNSFSELTLTGPFVASAGMASCDVNSDNLDDLLISDPGQDSMFIYEQNLDGGFTRSQQLPLGGL